MGQSLTHEKMVEQIRLAFASGQSAAGEEFFVSALDAGLPWDLATRAAALGVAERYRERGSRQISPQSAVLA